MATMQAPEIAPDLRPEKRQKAASPWTREIVRGAIVGSFTKLDPRVQARNPVMFVVEVGSVVTTVVFLKGLIAGGVANLSFVFAISVWLWFTVLFANFAEAMAEGRGKAQADTLRRTRRDTTAKRVSPD